MNSNETATIVANYLLLQKAVILKPNDPFTWASGWKSPIYCNNRKSLSNYKIRHEIANFLAISVKENYPDVEVIAGVSTSGIPWATIISEILELPLIYVRAEPKDHGLKGLVEGDLIPGQKVVVIEDLISTGKSSLQVVNNILDAGGIVLGLSGIFSYEFPIAIQKFQEANVAYKTLTNYEILLTKAVEENYVTSQDLETLSQWLQDPGNWRNDLK